MAPKTPNIQLLGETLTRHYRLSCELYNTYPIGRYTHQFSQGKLEINLADVDLDHLEALCHTLQNKVTPLLIFLYISPGKEVGVKTIQRAIRGISVSLSFSMTVSELSVNSVSLRGDNLRTLCQGLSKSRSLKALSLRGCGLGSNGTELLCQSIKNVPSITHLALTQCSISEKGALAVANLIQHQRMNRDSAMWQDTLRLRQPHLDGMRGLRRITLNDNPQIGDAGVAAMGDVLIEDLWIKALDLQHCGLSSESGTFMKNVLKTNQVLEIIDLRRNPFISNHLVNEVTALLSERQDEYAEQQYTWLDLNCPPPSKLDDKNVEVKTGTYAATGRNRQGTKSKTESQVIVKKPSIPRQHGIPWRVEHRLYERREGMAPGALVETVPSVPEGDFPEEEAPHHQPSEESSVTSHKMIKKLEHYKKCYRKERQLRKHAEKKLARLKAKIKKSHILDEATVTHIETCFQKFQKFLTHLQSLGLHMQLLMPEFEMGNAEGKVLQSSLHPKADAVESFQDSEYRHVSCIPPELLEPSGSQHPVAVFHNPTETDVGVNQQENNTAIPVRQEHLTDKSSEASILPENNLMLLKTSNEVQNTAFSELSEAIDKGTNMLSLLPRGEALEEVDHNPESETSEKDENDDSCSEDEEEISSFHRKSIDHIEQPVLNDYYKDINIKFEGSGMIEANSSEQSCIIIKANHNDSSDSQGLSIKIQGVEDLHVIPNELVTGGVEASSVSSADISNQNIVMELPSLEKQDSMDIPNTEDRSERMRNIKETPDRAGKIIGIKETLNNESMTGKYERVKESSEYSYQKDNVAERHQEIIQDGFIREIPTEDCTNYVEYDDRKSLYQMEDHADIGQSNEVSETDDEKLRMRQSNFNWSGRSGSVSSSVSIAEHLSHSHSRWSKGKSGKKLGRDKQVGDTGKIQTLGKREIKRYHHNTDNIQVTIPVSGKLQPEAGEVEYDSDFEVSDVEGVSISASSLTSTSIPDDLVTPGEEDF